MNKVILIGSTNNIRNIDPAFIRSGRFEHIFKIDLPKYKDRIKIIKILLKKNNLLLNSNVTVEYLSQKTAGFSGADIKKLFKIIIKNNKKSNEIYLEKFIEAYLECTLGKENEDIIFNNNEKQATAIHESGHCILEFLLSRINNSYYLFDFVTISFRGNICSMNHGKECLEYKTLTKDNSKNEISILLAGRVAQEVILNKIDSRASHDLKKATLIAENMIIKKGLGKNISQKYDTKELMNEVNEIINTEYKKVTHFFQEHKILILEISNELIKKEILYKEDIETIVNDYEKKHNIKLIYS